MPRLRYRVLVGKGWGKDAPPTVGCEIVVLKGALSRR